MSQRPITKKRLSYSLLAPEGPLVRLDVPPPGYARHFDPRPLLFSSSTGTRVQGTASPGQQRVGSGQASHPKHCLGVSALALDLTTVVLPVDDPAQDLRDDSADSRTPTGILYSAGRDGLMAAWDLGLPTMRRRQRAGMSLQLRQARHERMAELGAFQDDDSFGFEDGLSSDEQSVASDTDSINTGSRHDHRPRRPSRTRKHKSAEEIPYEEKWQIDHSRLDDPKPSPKTAFRQSVQPHSDWINDIVLCNMNQTVVSASSDQCIRAWNPHSPQASSHPALLGSHDDFVKCLAHSRLSNWVASGGFDRKIKIWDLAESREAPIRAVNISLCGASSYMAAVDIPLASEQDSIYSLATNASGTVLASGSPSRMVRLWDPRMQNCEIAGLRGHADNIRSLLLSEDAKFVLSASTDATIKLWSTAMQRCLHTFTYHNDSVWSLYSNHPDLEIFYSGDRSGLVCKVDLEGCGDMAEGECVVLCKDDEPPPSADAFSLSEGINSIVAVDDAFLWTATGSSSIMRWQDVKPRRRRAHPARVAARNPISSILGTSFSQPPPLPEEAPAPLIVTTSPSLADRRGVSFAPSLNDSDTDSLSAAGPVPIVTPLYTRRPSSIKQSSMHQISPMAQSSAKTDQCLDGLPLESLVCFALGMAYNSPFSTQSIMQRQQYAESLASLTSAGHRRPSHTPHSQQHSFSLRRTSSRNWDGREETPVVPSSMLAYAQRESASEAVPLRLAANEVILGRRGLIRCEQLNDRRTVLTADTAGDIAAWDILACRCLGVFDRTQLSALRPAHSPRVSMSDKGRAAKELLELVRDRVEGEGTASAWATTDVRCGALSVHLDETRCFAAELYSDDADLICLTPLEAARINPGKVILRNIFDRFLATTVHNIAATRPLQPLPRHKQLPRSHISIPQLVDPLPVDLNLLTAHRKGSVTAGIALATPAATAALPPSSTDLSKRATDTSFSARRLNPAGVPGFATPAGERNGSTDYFAAAPPQDAATSPTQTKSTSKLMGKLKGLGRSGTKKGPTTDSSDADSSAPVSREPSTSTRRGDPQMDAVGEMLSQPLHIPQAGEVPVLRDFPTDLIYSISEQGQGADIWSVIYRGMASTTGTDEAQVVAFAPLWVLEYLLAGRSNTPDPLRITFLVRSWTEAPDHPALPEMPESHARLTANRQLRMNKVAAFVVDRLDFFHHQVAPVLPRNVSHTSLASHNSAQSASSTLKPAYLNRQPEEIVELICGNTVVPPRATLAAVRQYAFKKSGELVLHYRLRAP